jgi:transcriptional regulator with XRE-family HTH domain
MNPQVTFVTRLRRERQRHGIALDDIARQSRIKVELLEAFENNDLTDWPRGLYARAWIRAYAVAVGLDPADTVDEFCRLYLHGDRRARSTIREIAEIASTDSEYRDDIGHDDRRRAGRPPSARQVPPAWYAPLVQAWRALRARLASLLWVTDKPREARRAPRTS